MAFANDLLYDLGQVPSTVSGPQFSHLFHKTARRINAGRQPES